MRGADACVGSRRRDRRGLAARGTDILLAVGSDHGQETIGEGVDVDDWLARHGLAVKSRRGAVAVAGQGTAALLYATPDGTPALLGVLDRLRAEPWVDDVVVGEALDRLGFAPSGGVVAAVNMARAPKPTTTAWPAGAGRRWKTASSR